MNKIYNLVLASLLILSHNFKAQQAYVKAPAGNIGSTVLAPNATTNHNTFRGCFLVTQAELSAINTITAINAFGFNFINGCGGGPPVNGSLQVYFEATNDVTYLKGTNWSSIIGPMTSVYNSTMTIPSTPGTATVNMMINPFTYTGGAIYVAYDWISNGPFATTPANYQASNTMTAGGAVMSTIAPPAATTLAPVGLRPNFNFGYINTYTNEAQALQIFGHGRYPLYNGSPYTFSVQVKNNCAVTMTNVVATATVSGANSAVLTTTIPSIAAGASLIASFSPFTPTAQGISTINVSMAADQNTLNNVPAPITQSITCNYHNWSPPVPISSYSQGVGFNPGTSGILVHRVRVPNASTVTAVKIGIANFGANTGNSIYGVLLDNIGNILATSNTLILAPSHFNTWQLFTYTSAVAINPNQDYWAGIAQTSNAVQYFPLASQPTPTAPLNPIPLVAYGQANIGGGFVFSISPTLGWFALETVFYNGITVTVTPQSSTLCTGNSQTIAASGATSYSWSNGASTSSIVLTPSINVALTVTGTAIQGTVGTCEDVKNVSILVNVSPTIACPNGAICPTPGSHTLAPTGAATYTFSGGGAVVSPTTTTQYTITGTSGAGCPAVNTVVTTVSVSNTPSVAITGPSLICLGASPIISAAGSISYSWSTGSTFSSVIVSPGVTTTYSVTGTFGSCTATAALVMSVSPNPSLNVSSTHSLLCVGNSATLVASGAQTYSWTNGPVAFAYVVSPTVTTDYTITAANNAICQQSVTFTQLVDPCIGMGEIGKGSSEIRVFPNPNNGAFKVYVSGINDNASVQIFNALGQAVLTETIKDSSTDIDLRTLAKGVYFIQLKEKDSVLKTKRVIVQ